jgi:hypothetical protein
MRRVMRTGVTPGFRSESDGVLKRLAGRDHFTAIVMAAMAADMMGAFQLTAIAALRMRFVWQSLMAAPHPSAGGRRLTFRNSHGTESFLAGKQMNIAQPRRLADSPIVGKTNPGRSASRRRNGTPRAARNGTPGADPPMGARRAAAGPNSYGRAAAPRCQGRATLYVDGAS